MNHFDIKYRLVPLLVESHNFVSRFGSVLVCAAGLFE